MLRHPKNRKVLRAGRRLGKTATLAVMMLHYAYTHNHGRVLVLTPMKSQGEVIYKEMLKLASNSDVVQSSVTRAVTAPYHVIEFVNGSIIRFFSTGLKSGGKSDVARGQEAHLIILDELDYMGPEDLDAVLAMLQKTAEGQEDKILVGASTPTGRREKLWEWCTKGVAQGRFVEFWFPSYCNPFFSKEMEAEFREEYSEMVYRHEIEADWGEDLEGVYPRRWVEIACHQHNWRYMPDRTSARSFHVIGVDWDKYGAGVNIVVLEVCQEDYEDERFAGKTRVVYREETIKEEFTLTKAVNRVIELNSIFDPRHIYVDRGYGEVQFELLKKFGHEHPETLLHKRVVGISFSEHIEVRDPVTKAPIKKDIKPYMVDNLRMMLEREQLLIPADDELLFKQLLGYVVARTTETGRPVFQSALEGDHAHDALILAVLSIVQNYGELTKLRYARRAKAVSSESFLPVFDLSMDGSLREKEIEIVENVWGDVNAGPIRKKRAMTAGRSGKANRKIKRRLF
jgi:replicative DNA helicase